MNCYTKGSVFLIMLSHSKAGCAKACFPPFVNFFFVCCIVLTEQDRNVVTMYGVQ